MQAELIDRALLDIPSDENDWDDLVKFANDVAGASTVEAIPKSEYEQRLKAEKLALLEELQKEVNELYINNPMAEFERDMDIGIEKATDVIQEKIDTLNKGEYR